MGHTIQSGVNSACDRQVLRVDVGLSRGCGNGTVEVLEILNDNQVVRLSETRGTQVLDSPEMAAAAAAAVAGEAPSLASAGAGAVAAGVSYVGSAVAAAVGGAGGVGGQEQQQQQQASTSGRGEGAREQQQQGQDRQWPGGSGIDGEQRGLMLSFLQGLLGVAGAASAREEGKGEGGRKWEYADISPA